MKKIKRIILAATAMHAFIVNNEALLLEIKQGAVNRKNGRKDLNWARCLAHDAVEASDALIAQLEKTKSGESPRPVGEAHD